MSFAKIRNGLLSQIFLYQTFVDLTRIACIGRKYHAERQQCNTFFPALKIVPLGLSENAMDGVMSVHVTGQTR